MTDAQLPSPNDLDASLDAALSTDLQVSPPEGSLDDEALGDPLVDELAIVGESPDAEGLQYLVKIAEQYPGLKITLSFG